MDTPFLASTSRQECHILAAALLAILDQLDGGVLYAQTPAGKHPRSHFRDLVMNDMPLSSNGIHKCTNTDDGL